MARKFVGGLAELLLLRHIIRFLAYLRSLRGTGSAGKRRESAEEVSAVPEPRPVNLRRRLLVSLAIGVAIEAVLIVGQSLELPILVATEDAAMDFVMRQFRNVKRDEHTAFVLLEADQATFQMWGEPFYFHRDRVQSMIEFASGFRGPSEQEESTDSAIKPALIIVDIDLSKPGRDDGSEKLKDYLEQYSRAPNAPLILARTVNHWPEETSADAMLRERASFLDSVVNDERNRNIFWGVTPLPAR